MVRQRSQIISLALSLIAAGGLLLAALYFLNLAVFNYWAASGPPVSNPADYAARGNRFLLTPALQMLSQFEFSGLKVGVLDTTILALSN